MRVISPSEPLAGEAVPEIRNVAVEAIGTDAFALAAFHPELVPILPVDPIVGPAEVVCGVSPDSSYRLVKSAIDAATETLGKPVESLEFPPRSPRGPTLRRRSISSARRRRGRSRRTLPAGGRGARLRAQASQDPEPSHGELKPEPEPIK